jgi:type II secretion system protein G
MLKNNRKLFRGFTLVELLVVIAILGILVTIGLTSFTSAQARSRDAKRKADLKQISSALEIYYNDYEKYPGGSNGQILGCPSTGPTACSWGTSQFTDGPTVYFRVLPKDPSKGYNYYYRTVTVGSDNQGFQLYASLENSQDPSCLPGSTGEPDCKHPADVPSGCGGVCNFAITSPNTKP